MKTPTAYNQAYSMAIEMLNDLPDLEIRSALKEAGSSYQIPWGDEMGKFVGWAERRMGL